MPEFPDLPYREIIVSPYRFFYRIKDATVWVVEVWYGAQPPAEPALGVSIAEPRPECSIMSSAEAHKAMAGCER